ncbi:MAG: lysine--tRNA ligase [Euryarchaeota archaeon]|nr:lysine--tRNA ligase [Euryarchaeota archaeon]MDE1837748.1 lysine--tRNA ligase [Euryarchaeota archaeon]MDE1881144.1 lysine--tRNA ligase [Euryarchaeota archaeon]MDE2045430.1 lysine--tRNA ligase [Thermoplasmata archaeon]
MPSGETLTEERRSKRDRLKASGGLAYPYGFPGRVPLASVRSELATQPPGSELAGVSRRVAGRVQTIRQHGKTAFVPLRDQSGELQLFLRVDDLGEKGYQTALDTLDPGDLVGAEGVPVVTRRGEPSIRATSVVLLAKALRPPPEKWHGLQDPEARLRQRYVDLLSSPEVVRTFEGRSALVAEMRRYLSAQGFQEVETPVLGRVASGGLAHPFVTHYRFLEEDFRLRVALELPLKRLLVGGMERVFEIGKVFRNEDLDADHSPEFTMMELYWAYADYTDVRKLVEGLTQDLAKAAAPFLPKEEAEARVRDFTPPYPTVDYVEALEKESGISGIVELPRERLVELARAAGAKVPESMSHGGALDKLFGHYVESRLVHPTFVLDYPLETTPLAKRHRSKPGRVERFELFYRGMELGNAYSELNDPDDQEERFRAQLPPPAAGGGEGEESYAYDEDFVEALRYGMPPAGGLGMGVDRLAMAFLGRPSIKDVILFPPTRSLKSSGPTPAPGAGAS